MSDRRLQIQRALENLKSNERAAEFESLAAHLAKRRHPSLVVTERKADGGEDLTSFVADEQGRRIRGAVSLTGTLEKIRKDARRQRKLGVQSDLLVFVTTEAISNLEVGEWCRKFREEFGYDLAVLGQADLIAELEKPENEWLCADYLGIDPLVAALGSYLDEVIERSDKLLLAGIDPKSSDPNTCKRLDLANVYIGLSTGLRRPLREDEKLKRAADPQRNLATESVPVSALEAAAEHPRLVLTGLPGSGKTTFIRHLCLCLAQHLRTRDAAWLDRLRSSGWEGRPLVPIVVELRAFARSLPQDLKVPPESGALWKFFVEQVLDDGLRIHSDRLLKLLESGRALVIFEGLDEVPTGPQRQYVRAAIEVFAAARRFWASRVLVTCRSRAYAGEQLKLVDRTREDAPRFAEAPLEDFDRTRIQRFTESWYRELARLDTSLADSAVGRAEQLFSALQAPALWPHAGRPMLLTVMANVHARNDRLPQERAQVYADMVQILVESWDIGPRRRLCRAFGMTTSFFERVILFCVSDPA
ncbi:MAG: NACHT domain-containing protein [Verrucomicrobiales bacterium]|nr:NACHT domain-containing protein [Verrucomicrobiales bacterium]